MNINTAKIKYIVAREGLIIISLLIFMAASLYIDSWKTNKINDYVKDAKEIEIGRKTTVVLYKFEPYSSPVLDAKKQAELSKEWEKATPINHDPFMQPKAQFPKSTTYGVIKRTMDREYPNPEPGEWITWDEAPNVNIKARYDDKGNKLFIRSSGDTILNSLLRSSGDTILNSLLTSEDLSINLRTWQESHEL